MGRDHAGTGSGRRRAEAEAMMLQLDPGSEVVARVRKAAPVSQDLHSDTMLRTVIRNMQEVVVLLDRQMRLIEASNVAIEVMGLPSDYRTVKYTPRINKSHMTDADGKQFAFSASPPVRIVRGERLENEPIIWKFKNGTVGHFIVNGTPIRNSAGEVEIGLLVARDITQIHDLQMRTEKMVTELTWSQRNWRRLIDNMAVGVIFLDSELRIIQANRAYSREFASSVRLRRGMRIDEALPMAQECGILDLLKTALQSEKPVQVKCFKYDGLPSGPTYWNGSAVPVTIHRENGTEISLAMVLVDVTDEIEARDRLAEIAALREKRARELEAERARLDTIIQSTPIPLAVIGTDGKVIACNSAAHEVADKVGVADWMCGKTTMEEITGAKIKDCDGVERAADECPWSRSLHGETCRSETIRLSIGARPSHALNVNSAPLKDALGNVTGAVIAVQDVTEQQLAQERISEIYQREHQIAEKLRGSFLPGAFPQIEGFEVEERYSSAMNEAFVGGDFYDIFRVGDGQLGIVMADVAGKGLKAAVYTVMTKYMLRAYALEDSTPQQVTAKLNEALAECTPTEVFVTLVYGVLDSRSGVFTYSNAGHEQPVFFSRSSELAYSLDVTGRALALAHGSVYTACEVEMHSGDTLVLYTDGITDAGYGANRMGVDRLLRTVESCASLDASGLADALLNAAQQFSNGRLTDDAALMIIRAA